MTVAAELAWYVYGVVPATASAPADLVGVDRQFPVELVPNGPLAAVTSRLRPEELAGGTEEDVRRVVEGALAHETVLEAVLASGAAVVPFRFGTVAMGADDVVELLRTREEELLAALARVNGRVELGVKAYAERTRLAAVVRAGDERLAHLEAELAAAGPGAAHLRGRQLERLTAEAAAAERARIAAELHERLAAAADDARSNPLPAADDGLDPVLNGAYLVACADEPGFRVLAEEAAAAHAEVGLRLDVSGPWPAYNFVEVEDG